MDLVAPHMTSNQRMWHISRVINTSLQLRRLTLQPKQFVTLVNRKLKCSDGLQPSSDGLQPNSKLYIIEYILYLSSFCVSVRVPCHGLSFGASALFPLGSRVESPRRGHTWFGFAVQEYMFHRRWLSRKRNITLEPGLMP